MNEQIGPFKKTAIIGVGLMGGSLALALRGKRIFGTIYGFARSEKSYQKLKKLNLVDRVEKNIKVAVEGADIVILAAPVYAIVDYFKTIAPFLKKKAIVLDLGSTKEYIVAAAKKYLPRHVEFIGCHPLCGGEKSGAEFSRKDLYKNAPCFVVNDNFSGFGFKVTKLLWESAGGHVIALSAIEHDRILAFVSHMPHIVSFTMAAELPGYCLDFAGPAFKDMTRVAASPVNVWADIFLSNKDNILNATGKFIEALEKFRKLIKEENKRGVYEFIEKANRKQKNY